MEWYWSLSIALVVLLALMMSGLPVFAAFLLANVVGVMLVIGPAAFGMFTNSIYDTLTAESFATIPLFILMGEILFRSGSVEVLSQAVNRLIGRLVGRMYFLVIALSTIFGALSGSAVAVAAMLGRSVLPQMKSMGYDTKLSNFTILGGASLAPIIPPSLLVVVIGSMVNNVSIAGLLIAGIVPGVIIALIMATYIWLRVKTQPELAPPLEANVDKSWSEVAKAIISTLPFGIVIFSVMGLILLGVATPSEAAAAGVAGAIVTAAIYKKLSLKMLWTSFQSGASISAMILLIVASSKFFGQLLSFIGATSGLLDFLAHQTLDTWIMLLILMLVPLILCMFVDQFAFMLLAIPLYEPIIRSYGFDPLWFWTLFLINLTIGSLTPPFGYTLFALKGAAPDLPMKQVYSSAWPVVVIFLSALILFALFPVLITSLPGLFA